MSANDSSEEESQNSNSDYLLQRLTKKLKDSDEVVRIQKDYKAMLALNKSMVSTCQPQFFTKKIYQVLGVINFCEV